jgi:hypothetical protein
MGPESSNSGFAYTIRLIIQEFVGGRQKTILHVDNVCRTNDPVYGGIAARRTAIRRMSGSMNVPGTDMYGVSSGPFLVDIRIVVDTDGLCGIWRTARHSKGTQLYGIRFDMFRNEFDILPRECNYPECSARTIHGLAYDISNSGVELWTDMELSEAYRRTVEGDDDFVVLFGTKDYIVLIP